MLVTRIGASNANSFVTLDQADYIIGKLPDDPTSWDALTDDEMEYRLILAAQIIGKLPLRGRRVYRDQALAFPRTIWISDDQKWRDEEDSRRVPDEVKEAQVMVAYSAVHRALANRGSVTDGYGKDVTGVSLGGAISVSFGGRGGTGTLGNLLDLVMRSLNAPVYLKMQRHLSQIRGLVPGNIYDDDYWEDEETLPTTTTTTSTTTTSSSATSSSSSTTVTSP